MDERTSCELKRAGLGVRNLPEGLYGNYYASSGIRSLTSGEPAHGNRLGRLPCVLEKTADSSGLELHASAFSEIVSDAEVRL